MEALPKKDTKFLSMGARIIKRFELQWYACTFAILAASCFLFYKGYYSFSICLAVFLILFIIHFFYWKKRLERYINPGRPQLDLPSCDDCCLKYKLMFDNMINAASIQDVIQGSDGEVIDFMVVAVNKAYESHTGLKPADVLGKRFSEVFPDVSDEMIQRYGEVAVTGVPFYLEYYSCLFKKYFHVSCYSPQPGRFVCLFEDISQLKLQQDEITMLTLAVDQSVNVIMITDTEGAIQYVNHAFVRLNGYSQEEVIGKKPSFLNAGVLPKEHYQKLWLNLKAGIGWEGEFCNVTKSGQVYWENAIISILKDHEGRVAHYLAIKENITDRKAAEQERKERENKYRELFDEAIDAVFLADLDSAIIVDCNKAAEELLVLSKIDIIGSSIHRFFPAECFLQGDGPVACRSHASVQLESVVEASSGLQKDVSIKTKHFVYRGKNMLQGIFRDITLSKKAQKDLMDSYVQLEQLNATKDKFFSIIAHDLKNPLSGLKALTNQLHSTYREITAEHASLYIRLIDEAANQAYCLTEDLLAWSRIQNKSFQIRPDIVELRSCTQEVLEEHSKMAFVKNIILHNSTSEDHLIFADKNMVKAVLRNLISNAIKFTHANGLVIIGSDDNDHEISVSVKDNGVGIARKNQAKLFRIDVSYTSEGTEREKGTGMGLILCKEFVEKNKGSISLISDAGKGSTFIFKLPKYYGQEVRTD